MSPWTRWNASAATIDAMPPGPENSQQGEEDAAGQEQGSPEDTVVYSDAGQREPEREGGGSETDKAEGGHVDVEAEDRNELDMYDCIAYRRVDLDAHADGLIPRADENAAQSGDDD